MWAKTKECRFKGREVRRNNIMICGENSGVIFMRGNEYLFVGKNTGVTFMGGNEYLFVGKTERV